MFDLNLVDDVFDYNYSYSKSNTDLASTVSLFHDFHVWYRGGHHAVQTFFLASLTLFSSLLSMSGPRQWRPVCYFVIVYSLLWLQRSYERSGDIGINLPKRVVVKNMQNSSYEESRALPAGDGISMMQFAKDAAVKVCQEEQGGVMVLVKTVGDDREGYFSLYGGRQEQRPMKGGFLFDCPELLAEVQESHESPAGIILINEPKNDLNDLLSRTVSQFPWTKNGGLNAFYEFAFALFGAGIVLWFSTRTSVQQSQSKDPRPKTKQINQKAASYVEKPQKKDAVTTKSLPVVQTSEIALKSDDELVILGLQNRLRLYSLEAHLNCPTRAVSIRRRIIAGKAPSTFNISGLPFKDYNYARVMGTCCENVIGYLPVPVGFAGPLNIDGKAVFVPMATTEGALVASTNRGCSAINASGGVTSIILGDGMTRGPVVRFASLARAGAAKLWLDSEDGYKTVQEAFNSTSRFGRLQSVKGAIAGSDLYIRFKAHTGDAMGMNMISKGVERALAAIVEAGFGDMRVVSLSGNYCTDKKAAAINWVDGRGKSVAAQATISAEVLKKVLKVDAESMVELNTSKNLVGSALAGAMGGFNAHAANIIAAVFLATGQDIAQVVESSACLTTMRNINENLQISVTMPSIEVGTVGGGTVLEAQGTMLDLLGVRGANMESPGGNAQELARIVAAAVLAGELSLCSALAVGSLVSSHMALNRK